MVIQPQEVCVLMDFPEDSGYAMTVDELLTLSRVGVRTSLQWIHWSEVNTAPGIYDWSKYDRVVERTLKGGMKLLLGTPSAAPGWLPLEWWAQNELHQPQGGTLSLWNPDAQNAQAEFIRLCQDRYASEFVQLYFDHFYVGETLYCNTQAWFDPWAEASYRASGAPSHNPWFLTSLYEMLKRQLDLFPLDSEFWFAWHPMLSSRIHPALHGNGCDLIDPLLQLLRAYYPTRIMNLLQYTYFPHGKAEVDIVDELRRRYNVNLWPGAEYCEGLRINRQYLEPYHLRGFLVGPKHPFTLHKHLEPWMVELMSSVING